MVSLLREVWLTNGWPPAVDKPRKLCSLLQVRSRSCGGCTWNVYLPPVYPTLPVGQGSSQVLQSQALHSMLEIANAPSRVG